MSKKTRFFKCNKDHITERLVKDNITIIACGECKEEAAKMLAAPIFLGNSCGKNANVR